MTSEDRVLALQNRIRDDDAREARERRRRTIAAVLCIVALAAVCGLIAGVVLAIG